MQKRAGLRLVLPALLMLTLIFAFLWLQVQEEDQSDPVPVVHFRRGEQSVASFSVELATTPEQQIRGLMGREELAEGSGMLFIYAPPRNAGMWMKNMLISLDFLFMDERGVVVHIAEQIPPCPTEGECPTIESGQPVKYVLEVSAGTVERYGLAVGDLMRTSLR